MGIDLNVKLIILMSIAQHRNRVSLFSFVQSNLFPRRLNSRHSGSRSKSIYGRGLVDYF
jgi:hypothetical protein